MKAYLFCLVSACLLSTAVAKMVYSTTDNRYPSHIVNDPRVECYVDGSFPHPADCTWFYRCSDRFGVGIFHVYFFQCEPGTIFHDDLDQCVYGSPGQCNSVYPIDILIPPVTPIATERPPIIHSSTQFPTTSDIPINPTPTEPTAPPSTPVPTQTTPTAGPPGITPGTPETTTEPPVTTAGPPAPPTTTVDPETTTTGTTQTTVECSNCLEKWVCVEGNEPALVNLCETCTFANGFPLLPQAICSKHPDAFLSDEMECFYRQDICEAPAIRDPQNAVPHINSADVSVTCSNAKVRPDDPEIRNLFCQKYHYCSESRKYLGAKNLCRNYFQCYKSRDGSWSVQLMECSENYLYNYETDLCLPKPKASSLC